MVGHSRVFAQIAFPIKVQKWIENRKSGPFLTKSRPLIFSDLYIRSPIEAPSNQLSLASAAQCSVSVN